MTKNEHSLHIKNRSSHYEKDQEELDLETVVLGGSVDCKYAELAAQHDVCTEQPFSSTDSCDLFVIDRTAADELSSDGHSDGESAAPAHKAPKLWHDAQDDMLAAEAASQLPSGEHISDYDSTTTYTAVLQRRFVDAMGHQTWASGSSQHDDDEHKQQNEQNSVHAVSLLAPSSQQLPRAHLQISQCTDLTRACTRTQRPPGTQRPRVNCVHFHRRCQLALVTTAEQLHAVQVDGEQNPLAHTFADTRQLQWARFLASSGGRTVTSDATVIAAASYQPKLYVYDMDALGACAGQLWLPHLVPAECRGGVSPHTVTCGDLLYIPCAVSRAVHLVSVSSRRLVDTFHIGQRPTAVCLSPDGASLYIHSQCGDVFVYDTARRACVHRFHDEGCLAGTCVAMTPDAGCLVTGASSGVLNVYRAADVSAHTTPKPLRVVGNLTTAATQLHFNRTGELLCAISGVKPNALRLLHAGSLSVFDNFPGASTYLSRLLCVDTSPLSGYLALGNSQGRALLYRLHHYSAY